VKQILLLPAKCSDMLVDTIGDSFLFCSITPCLSIMCSRSLCGPFYYEIQLMDGWISIVMNVSCAEFSPKKSSLLSPPLCSSNVRVCSYFSDSCVFHSRVFHPCSLVPHFPPRQSGAAFSTPAFLLLTHFPLPRFQSPLIQL